MPTRKQEKIRKITSLSTGKVVEETVPLKVEKKLAQAIELAAKNDGSNVNEILEDVFGDGFYVAGVDAEETVVTLKYLSPWSASSKTLEPKGEEGKDTQATLSTYRRLRDTFPPVSLGIEHSKSFTSGGGFQVDVDDNENLIQIKTKNVINELNRNIYQDEVTRGMDAILDILLDEAFTVGCSAAEIVYEKFKETPPDTSEYLEQTSDEDFNKGAPLYTSRKLEKEDWKALGGIVQLKIIDDSVNRMKAYRNPLTYKIEYWTVDENQIVTENNKHKDEPGYVKKEVPTLLPWQVLWLSWDRRGSNLFGNSLIMPAAKTALLLEDVLAAIGLSFKKWSDRKYFFILGSDKTGRSWAPPKVNNFLRDVKKMTTEGGTGVAVPAGFDLKDIGGEIYEGSAIIDDLQSLICAGMRYPRTFLEQGKTQEGESAWLAWIVTYSGHQKLLRRTIEHQLWARHLYCVMGGTTYKEARQGVKPENNPELPIYVPKMSWKSEGKWHVKQKIDELSKILNVANPVSPELKLEVESDIATTLGYSELSLDNSRKVLKMRQEINVIEADSDKIKAEILKEVMEKALNDKEFKEGIVPLIEGTTQKQEELPEEPAVMKEGGVPKEPKGDNPSRPLPVPLKRLAGGVSRYNKETGKPNEKEMAKEPGDTRQPKAKTGTTKAPKKAEESEELENMEIIEETEDMVQFETYEELLMTSIKMREHKSKQELYMKMIDLLDKMGGAD